MNDAPCPPPSGLQRGNRGPTSESNDGSKLMDKRIAVAPSPNAASIPLQLIKAEPATGTGVLTSVSYIQRLDTTCSPQGHCTNPTTAS